VAVDIAVAVAVGSGVFVEETSVCVAVGAGAWVAVETGAEQADVIKVKQTHIKRKEFFIGFSNFRMCKNSVTVNEINGRYYSVAYLAKPPNYDLCSL
jgi:hypothetical protein